MNYNILSKYRTELMGAAILWVMLFHSTGLGAGFLPLRLFRAAGFGGVDIFILLSSMGLVISLTRREQDYSSFMARRASRVLPAYYLVMVPYTIFLILYHGVPWSTLLWNTSLLYYWVSPIGAFNWYVAGSMTFYAVTPACFRRFRRSGHRELLTEAGILAGLAASRVLMTDNYWQVTDMVYRIPIFFLGLLLGFYVLEGRRLEKTDILFWFAWLGLGIGYLLHFGKGPYFEYHPLCYLFLFTTIPMCLTACWLFEHLPLGWLQKPLRLLGRNSLEIYLLNVSFFSELELLQKFFSFPLWIYFLLSYTVNITLGILLHKAVEQLSQMYMQHKQSREAA